MDGPSWFATVCTGKYRNLSFVSVRNHSSGQCSDVKKWMLSTATPVSGDCITTQSWFWEACRACMRVSASSWSERSSSRTSELPKVSFTTLKGSRKPPARTTVLPTGSASVHVSFHFWQRKPIRLTLLTGLLRNLLHWLDIGVFSPAILISSDVDDPRFERVCSLMQCFLSYRSKTMSIRWQSFWLKALVKASQYISAKVPNVATPANLIIWTIAMASTMIAVRGGGSKLDSLWKLSMSFSSMASNALLVFARRVPSAWAKKKRTADSSCVCIWDQQPLISLLLSIIQTVVCLHWQFVLFRFLSLFVSFEQQLQRFSNLLVVLDPRNFWYVCLDVPQRRFSCDFDQARLHALAYLWRQMALQHR